MSKLPRGICSKFAQLCFCKILLDFIYSWESYHKNIENELFVEKIPINLNLTFNHSTHNVLKICDER